ncbi:MAG: hypothetical protein CL946_00200 [Ectothiorhodospiraceae bacterium]|nr:hypothetical protein [Ectothiorhodospiraceae bacterium]
MQRTFLLLLPLLLVSFLVSPLYSQQKGNIYGTVRDSETGEELIGANVVLVGTDHGAASNLSGKYRLNGVPPGSYNMKASYVGYSDVTVEGITLHPGESLKLDIDLVSDAFELGEVVVSADRVIATESALLAARKKAATIGDGISIETVKRSPDANSADALKRVTGVSIVDNKFVFVRGVTDRYNSATLNGVNVTSTDTDVDKKSFAFDMIPSNLLTNLNVVKTVTPDLPGDFTGGLVQVNTLDFPDQQTLKLSLSSSYNEITTGEEILKSQSSGTDHIGFDDGFRELPNVEDDSELPPLLNNNWKPNAESAPFNGSLSLSAGDRFTLGDNQQLGYVAALSYKNGYKHTNDTLNFTKNEAPVRTGTGTIDEYSVLWGSLLNLSYQPDEFNKIKLSNNFNQNAEDDIRTTVTLDENEDVDSVVVTEWSQRSTYVGQLAGQHMFPQLGNLELDWQGSYASSIANEPDRKVFIRSRNVRFPYDRQIMKHADRSWSRLAEFSRTASINLSYPVTNNLKFKLGVHRETKNRSFQQTFFLINRDNVGYALTSQTLDTIFVADNFNGPGEFYYDRLSRPEDEYTAIQDLWAGYVMFDYRFSLLDQQFRFVGGVRRENSDQQVETVSPFETGADFVAQVKEDDWLPSFNFTYLITDDINFRLAYGKSVNRPEFRELAAFYFYDYNLYEGVFGNPLLERAIAENYDARIEYFPQLGEVIALSYFRKAIINPIELRIIPSSNPERTWFNSPFGENYGLELEIRKTFDFFGDYGRNFSIAGNYSRIFSEISYTDAVKVDEGGGVFTDSMFTATREMAGQSPYTINFVFTFNEPTWGTTFTVLYNEFGERLYAVGDERTFDIYEQPRPVIDLSVSQQIMGTLNAKFTIKDLNAQPQVFQTRVGDPWRRLYRGTSYSLSVSYTII